jgi:hypothetical protein
MNRVSLLGVRTHPSVMAKKRDPAHEPTRLSPLIQQGMKTHVRHHQRFRKPAFLPGDPV